MAVKANQPDLLWTVQHLLADPGLVAATGSTHVTVTVTVDKGHGRLERRHLRASDALVSYLDWPGHAQALGVKREVTILATGEVRRERAYAVTSLPPGTADAPGLLRLWRLHWVRDVLFAEDRSGATVGNVPQMLAALHSTTIGVLRAHGRTTIASARRHLAHAAPQPPPPSHTALARGCQRDRAAVAGSPCYDPAGGMVLRYAC